MLTVRYKVRKEGYTRKMTELLNTLNDKEVRKDVNQIIADKIQPYVPMKSGKLRKSLYVGVNLISWGTGLPYAKYQYGGIVYAPNIPIIKNGIVVGWYSPRGKKKYPTNRELGGRGMWSMGQNSSREPAVWKGWNFGYTTMGTMHHWDKVYEWKLKSDTNKQITLMLKKLVKQRTK